MGNHRESGRDQRPAGRCAKAGRAISACAAIAVAVLAFGFHGPAVSVTSNALSASGSVGPGTLDPDAVNAGTRGPVFSADPLALVSYGRTVIKTRSKDGKHELNVASADLKRPPAGSLMAPLETLNPSSPFGLRASPITGSEGEFHWGQDYAAACGTRVYAADSGVVRAVGWHLWGGGNRVEIDHGNGLITTYNHLEAIAVKKGDSVHVGEVIARVGTTGSSTGCHLHFETILNGQHANPLRWTLLATRQLDPLADIEMVSYLPTGGTPASGDAPQWAIPVSEDHTHTVLGGEDELPVAPNPDGTVPPMPPGTDPGQTTQPTPSPTPTPTPPPTATPTPSPPPTPTPTPAPPPTATPTPSPTPSPTPTPTPSPTPTPTPTPPPTATPTPSPPPTPTPTTPTPTPTIPPESSATPMPTAEPVPTP